MRLATSTNFFGLRLDGGYTSYKESMKRCKAAGFNVLDINFCQAIRRRTDLVKDNWQQLIEELRNEAEKEGVVFTQSHPVFVKRLDELSDEEQAYYHEMKRRSIIASSILGVKWAVFHPAPQREGAPFDPETIIKDNVELHGRAIELAKKHNVGVAFENLFDGETRRFGSRTSDLVDLIDHFNDPAIGACWDFGHANFHYEDQRDELRALGKRLKAMHVNDNDGNSDEHMFPFHGTINWHELLPVVSEIGYEGDFTYETHKEFDRLPEHLKDTIAKSGYEIGQYCLSLISASK